MITKKKFLEKLNNDLSNEFFSNHSIYNLRSQNKRPI